MILHVLSVNVVVKLHNFSELRATRQKFFTKNFCECCISVKTQLGLSLSVFILVTTVKLTGITRSVHIDLNTAPQQSFIGELSN